MTQAMNLNRMGFQEMSYQETAETEGGFLPLLILAAAALLASGCTIDNSKHYGNGSGNNSGNTGNGTGNSANGNGQNTGNSGGVDSTTKK